MPLWRANVRPLKRTAQLGLLLLILNEVRGLIVVALVTHAMHWW